MMAAIGLPGLNGFVGEFLVLAGTFLTHRWWAVVATGGVVLAALYLLWAYQQAFHHEPDEARPPRSATCRGARSSWWRRSWRSSSSSACTPSRCSTASPRRSRVLVQHVETSTGTHQPAVANPGPARVAPAPVVGDAGTGRLR